MNKQIKIRKYAKPYFPMIIIAVGLLFAQANFDLALPDYLSNIINTGIQQGGVESTIPEAMTQTEYNHVKLFLTEGNQTILDDYYSQINETSSNYESYQDRYTTLSENESIYVLKDSVTTENEETMKEFLPIGLISVYMINQIMENPEAFTDMGIDVGFNVSAMPSNMDFFMMLAMLPELNRTMIVSAISNQVESLGDMMMEQIALQAVSGVYEDLGMDMNKYQISYILRVGGWMILLTLLSAASTIAVGYLSAKTATGLAKDLRRDVFKTVEHFSSAEFDSFSTASLITRTTNDITQIQMVSMMLIRMVIYAPIIGIGGIIRALGKASDMWWLIAVAVGVLLTIILVVFRVAIPKFKLSQKLVDRLNLVSRESLTGMMVIRAFNQQGFEEGRFDKANQDLTSVSLFINRLMVILMPLMMLIMNVLSVSIIWIGSHEVADANMQVGDMIAFMQYAMQIVMSFLMMSMMFIMLPRASVSGDRISKVLNTQPTILDPSESAHFPSYFSGQVEFNHVSFKYPGAQGYALNDIHFTAKPGQTTAIIGATGAGKSTIVNLIPRFYDVTEGSIKIDGVDIRSITQHELRDKIGYVPQKNTLFTGSIRSNMLYANNDATDIDISRAIDIAQAREFVDSKSEKIDLAISQGGMNVSGGQKQRLSIARAIMKNPPIFILDDSFSALDFKTDAALRRAFKSESADSTLIIVSQRVSTIRNAEQILVLDEGRLVGKGTHDELMGSCHTYKEIALSQHTAEELK